MVSTYLLYKIIKKNSVKITQKLIINLHFYRKIPHIVKNGQTKISTDKQSKACEL